MTSVPVSPRSRLAAGLLCFFFGWLGAHRFYVGKVGTGLLMVVTVGGFGIWSTIDLILILAGSFTDADGLRVYEWMTEESAAPDGRTNELQGRMDRIDSQLRDLQGVLTQMTDKLDRRRYGHLV